MNLHPLYGEELLRHSGIQGYKRLLENSPICFLYVYVYGGIIEQTRESSNKSLFNETKQRHDAWSHEV